MEHSNFLIRFVNKRFTLLVIICVIALLIGIGIQIKKPSQSIELVSPEVRTVSDAVIIAGKVEALRDAHLAFETTGKISSASARVGDRVSAGQVLARLDSSILQAELAEAQAEVSIQRAEQGNATVNLDDVIREQDLLVENAYQTLLSSDLEVFSLDPGEDDIVAPTISGSYNGETSGQYDIRVYASNASSGASYRVTGMSANTDSVSSVSKTPLGKEGLLITFPASNDYVNSDWYVPIPNPAGDSYIANLNAYEVAQETRTRAIREARESLKSSSTEQSISSARLAKAEARVEALQAQIRSRRIVAPFSGTITDRLLERGEIATANETVYSILGDGGFKIVADVPEVDSVKITPDTKAYATLDAYGPDVKFDLTISSIDPAETIVGGVPVYQTELIFTEPDERVRSGMTANVTFTIGEIENALALPRRALSTIDEATTTVTLQKAESQQEIPVTILLIGSDSYIAIQGDLTENDRIVIPD